MAADVDAQDPVVSRRCSVCSAVVPYGQIVTGKAKIDGSRVVCERCRAAATSSPAVAAAPRESGVPGVVIFVVVIAVAGALGYFATQWYLEKQKANAPTRDGTAVEMAGLKKKVDERFEALESRLAESGKRDDSGERVAALDKRVDAEIATLRQMVADVRDNASKSNAELNQRIARLEGQIASLSDMVRGLAARSSSGPSAPPPTNDKPPTPPQVGGNDPPKPAGPPPVDPVVVRLCKDLLESPDDGTRFTAATELTTKKDPAAIPSLVKALAEDKHYFVRRGCARALGVIKSWLAVPALIRALEDREVYVALAANIAIQNITGNDFGVNQDTPPGQRKTKASAADKWWDKNKDHPPEGVSLHPITD